MKVCNKTLKMINCEEDEAYRIDRKWLNEIKKTSYTENKNYINVIKQIPMYFKTDNLFKCMMLAFNFGELRGRECEKDKIKWNALATFQWMKTYYDEKGYLPDTLEDLETYEKEFLNNLGMKVGDHNA